MPGTRLASLLRDSSAEGRPAISSRSRATTMLGITATSLVFSTGVACSDRDGPAAANVTPENVDAYLAELKDRVSSTTVHGSICKLRRAAQYMAPGRDFAWLAEIGKDLALVARPRSKFDRLVMTEVLVEAGLTLIHEAENSPNHDRACPSKSGSQWADGGIARVLSHPTQELRRLGDRPQLCENPRQMVDRAFGLGDEGEARRTSGPSTSCSHQSLTATSANTDRCWRGQITHLQLSGSPQQRRADNRQAGASA